MKHTELPWVVSETDDEGHYVIEAKGGSACICYGAGFYGKENSGNANGAFIVRACNCHYDLLEACRLAIKHIDAVPIHEPEDTKMLDVLRTAITKAEAK